MLFLPVVAVCLVGQAAAQIQGLNVGTVTAMVDGAAFSAPVSIAVLDEEGTLVLTNLGNLVQIQVPKARVGTFPITVDADGGLVDVIVGLRAGRRQITPVSGSITVETLTPEGATGRFEFRGKDLGTDAPVQVTGGRFQVKMTARR